MRKLSKTWQGWLSAVASYALLVAVATTMVLPFCWMIATSLKAPSADVMDMASLLPQPPTVLAQDDIGDYRGIYRDLLKSKANPSHDIYRQLWNGLPENVRQTAERLTEKDPVREADRANLRDALNQFIAGAQIVEAEAIASLSLGDEANEILRRPPHNMTPQLTGRLNRLLLESCFASNLKRPGRFRWKNYQTAWVEANIARAFLNSTVVAVSIVVGQLVTSSLAAFAFARLRFFGRDKLFLCYLATMMVPSAVTMIPVFILLRQLHWVNTYQALILPSMFTAYGTFMLRQFFLSIPRELEEAAVIDGCSPLRIYWHVALPLSKPGLAALGLLSFMAEWKSFMWPLIVTHTQSMFTLPVALVQFQDRFGVQWTLLMAGSIIMIAPMLFVFVVGQRFFVAGVRLGAVKG
ncbi:MAG: carbohydrate ABC transporter permease [Tardiphaga sp.]